MRRIISILASTVAIGMVTFFGLPKAFSNTCSQGLSLSFSSWPVTSKVRGTAPVKLRPPSGFSFSPFLTFQADDQSCSSPPCKGIYKWSQVKNPDPNEYKNTYLFFAESLIIELPNPSKFKAIEVGLVHFSSPGIEWYMLDRNRNVVTQGTAAIGRSVPEDVRYTESWTTGFEQTKMKYLVVEGVDNEQGITNVCTRY